MKKHKQLALENMISEATTSFDVSVESWQQAVLFAGDLLVKAGFVEARYPSAMVNWVTKLGPYVVIAPGVALPHARPEDGAITPCMSLITLKNPINFGNQSNDPVKLVIAFATTDPDSHVMALSKLARVLEEPERIEDLKNTIQFETVAKLMKTGSKA